MSELLSGLLPTSDSEGCFPHLETVHAKNNKRTRISSTNARMHTIEEETAEAVACERDSCSSASSVDEKKKTNLSAQTLADIEKIREAIQVICQEPTVAEDHRSEKGVIQPATPRLQRERASLLSVITDKLKSGLIKLRVGSRRMSTLLVKLTPRASLDKPSSENRAPSVIVRMTKISKSEYILKDKMKRPVSCIAATDHGVDSEFESSTMSLVDHDHKEDSISLLYEDGKLPRDKGPKYDLRTGMTRAEARSPKEQIRQAAVVAHHSAAKGVEKVRGQALLLKHVHHRVGRWSKIEG